MSAVNERDILRREHFRKEFLQRRRTGCRFRTGLDNHRVSAAHRRCHDTYRQQNREVKRTDYQRHTVRHLVDLRENTRPAHQSAEVYLRFGPFSQPAYHLVHFGNNRADVAQIGLQLASAEVFPERGNQLILMRYHGFFESFQLLDSPRYRQRLTRSEETTLCSHYPANRFFRILIAGNGRLTGD